MPTSFLTHTTPRHHPHARAFRDKRWTSLFTMLACATAAQGAFGQATTDTEGSAAVNQPAITQGAPSIDNDNASHIGNAIPEKPAGGGRTGPLAGIGATLNGWGITPVINLTQMYLANPSTGQKTGKHEALTFVTVGADLDMQKLLGINGATIHFAQLFVPFTNNLSYGRQVGDSIAGQPAPYIPKVSHLVTFTWEQKAFADRATLEFGKSNAGLYFGTPVCNQGFECQSPLLQDNAGFNPPVYSNWGARLAYRFTPAIAVQFGAWRSDPAAPFTNGWEWKDADADSTTYLANVTYHTEYATARYPGSYEFLLFHSTALQTDPSDTTDTHKGTSGAYLGGKQVVYRPDGGTGGASPTALSVFGSVTSSFDKRNSAGLQASGNAGLTLDAPFRSRSHDSYSIKFTWVRLTDDEQHYLQAANLAAGGTGYTVGRNEFALGLDANVPITKAVILSPFITRTWNTDAWGNPSTASTPRNGYAGGILLTVFFDKMLGLTDH
ncbi:MAG: carbohydrate porin [Janthinobacterium lividum]